MNVPVVLKSCGSIADDLKAIEEWGTIFEKPEKLTTTVTTNYFKNRKAISEDISAI